MKTLALQSQVLARMARARRGGSSTRASSNAEVELARQSGLIPLAIAHLLPESAGVGAARLGQLIEAGFEVPDGFVLTGKLVKKLSEDTLDAHGSQSLDTLWNALDSSSVVVCNCGTNHEGCQPDTADDWLSVQNVERAGLAQAVRTLRESSKALRLACEAHPGEDVGIPVIGEPGGVLVQTMVPAEYAGVLFTEHPTTSGAMLLETVAGSGEQLTSGSVTPDTFRFGKLSATLQSDSDDAASVPPIDLQPLLATGRELEVLFGTPQDIAWAFAGGRFHLLRVRDITRPVATGDSIIALAERERARLLAELTGRRRQPRRTASESADAPVLVKNTVCEQPPRPTPFSADLMKRLWDVDGSVDRARQALGVPYRVHKHSVPYMTTLFDWTYVNREEGARRSGKGPGALASFRMSRSADAQAENFMDDFLTDFRPQMIERNAIAFDRLQLDIAVSLLECWIERFVTRTWVQVERLGICAGHHVGIARDMLLAAKLDPARHLVGHHHGIAAQALALLSRGDVSEDLIEEFLLVFGHRAPLDFELSAPRFNEDTALVARHIERLQHLPAAQMDEDTLAVELAGKGTLSDRVARARRFLTLTDDARHYCLIELAQIRRLLLAIDHKAALDGRVFHLTIDEVASLGDAGALDRLGSMADQRADDRVAWASLEPPGSLSIELLERVDLISGEMPGTCRKASLGGTRVAGTEDITGVARIIAGIDDLANVVDGEILVARNIDQPLARQFAKAAGIVVETGGWLSNAATLAREFDLFTITGVENACTLIETGDVVSLERNGRVVLERDRRDPVPAPVPEPLPGAEGNAHAIDEQRRFRYTSAIERRAMKARHGDRRRQPRFDAQGELLQDRRAEARSANLSVYRQSA